MTTTDDGLLLWPSGEGAICKRDFRAALSKLGATVPRPHGEDARNGGCEITALAYHPHVHVAVTAAGNGGFKAWSRVEARAPSEAPTVPGVPDEGKRVESSPEPRWQWECSLEVAGACGGGRRWAQPA